MSYNQKYMNINRKPASIPSFQANIARDRHIPNVNIATGNGKIKRYYNPNNKHYYKFENSPCKECHQRQSQYNDCVEIIKSDEEKFNKIKNVNEHIECKCSKCVTLRSRNCNRDKEFSEEYEKVICNCKKCRNKNNSNECHNSSEKNYKTILWCKKCDSEVRNNRCKCKNMWYDS